VSAGAAAKAGKDEDGGIVAQDSRPQKRTRPVSCLTMAPEPFLWLPEAFQAGRSEERAAAINEPVHACNVKLDHGVFAR